MHSWRSPPSRPLRRADCTRNSAPAASLRCRPSQQRSGWQYQFGFWVHHSRATFDDLTITFELTDEFLDLNNLKAEIVQEFEEIPTTGPLAGIKGVPPRIRREIEQYAAGKGEARQVVKIVGRPGLPKKAREVAARLLKERDDKRAIPLVIDLLYSPDKYTRTLAIGVIFPTLDYIPEEFEVTINRNFLV